MENKSNYIRGAVELIILQILIEGECYGIELSALIEEYSGNILKIPVGTLYPMLYKLETKEYIKVDRRIVDKRYRTYYSISESGVNYYKESLIEYKYIANGINNILSRNKEDD